MPEPHDPLPDDESTFDDFDEEVDDNEAVAAYAEELMAAVADLGIVVLEPGTSEEEL